MPSPHITARRGLPWGSARTAPQTITVLSASATELVAGTGPLDTRSRLLINPRGAIYLGTSSAVTTTTGLLVAGDSWLELDGEGTWYARAASDTVVAILEITD